MDGFLGGLAVAVEKWIIAFPLRDHPESEVNCAEAVFPGLLNPGRGVRNWPMAQAMGP
jgi:hypothetical protein